MKDDETVFINISDATNASITDAQGILTIKMMIQRQALSIGDGHQLMKTV